MYFACFLLSNLGVLLGVQSETSQNPKECGVIATDKRGLDSAFWFYLSQSENVL